jgi:hypothetical protein
VLSVNCQVPYLLTGVLACCDLQAIHKQSFKERQKGSAAAVKEAAKRRGKRTHSQMEAQPSATQAAAAAGAAAWAAAAGIVPAAAAAAAAAGGADEEQKEPQGAPDGPAEVTTQVYLAATVWPQALQYLAAEATAVLMLPTP